MELTDGNKHPPPTLPGLISHIQTVAEHEKAVLARELHDELGGIGLFAALRWLVGNTCARRSLECRIQFPEAEPHFNPDASIALFRVAQEALAIIMESKWVRSVTLSLNGTADVVTLSIAGTGPASGPVETPIRDTYELATIRHRSAALGGGVTFSPAPGEVRLSAWIPRENSLVS
jgi:signal transduction histidine kinase